MLRPSTLIRFATLAGIALFVRAIVREGTDERGSAILLPPPRAKTTASRVNTKVKAARSRH